MPDFCALNCDVDVKGELLSKKDCKVKSTLNLVDVSRREDIRPCNMCEYVLKFSNSHSFQECISKYLEDSPKVEDEVFWEELKSTKFLYDETKGGE